MDKDQTKTDAAKARARRLLRSAHQRHTREQPHRDEEEHCPDVTGRARRAIRVLADQAIVTADAIAPEESRDPFDSRSIRASSQKIGRMKIDRKGETKTAAMLTPAAVTTLEHAEVDDRLVDRESRQINSTNDVNDVIANP